MDVSTEPRIDPTTRKPYIVSDNRGANASGVFLARWSDDHHSAGCDGCGWKGKRTRSRDEAEQDYLDHDHRRAP